MKDLFITRFFVIGIILILFTKTSYSQHDLQRLTNISDVIIEGKVIEQESFKSPKNGFIYTKNIISIFKIFKGSTLEDQLTIITKGGFYDGINQSWSHNFTLAKSDQGVFFLSNRIDDISGETYKVVEGTNGFVAFRKYGKHKIKGYAPFSIYENIESDIYKKIEAITNSRHIISLNEYENELLQHSLTLTSSECVEYKISDIEITIANNFTNATSSYFLEFDIDIRALQAAFDLRRTELKMEYSTSILGEYIVGNNNINVILGGDLGEYQLSLFDDTANKVGVDIEKLQSALALEINNSYRDLYHAIIEIQNFDLNAILQLTVDENFDLKTFKEEGSSSIEISCNEFNEDVNIAINQLLPPEITSYNSEVTAGTRTLLTINGNDFLPPNFNGSVQVWFTNANDHSVFEWIRPYNNDYVNVTGNQITVFVPSYALNVDNGTNQGKEYAGTGKFKVVLIEGGLVVGESEEKDLIVRYAARNKFYQNFSTQPILMTSQNFEDGYTVTYSQAFKDKVGDLNGEKFTDAFQRALDRWCMKTGLNFIVDEGALQTGDYDILVDMGQIDDVAVPAQTSIDIVYNSDCTVTINNNIPNQQPLISPNHPVDYPADFLQRATIIFNDNPLIAVWNAQEMSVPLQGYSVEQNALHEIGHAHGIMHTNNPDELMYWNPNSTTVTITNETEEASHYLISHSANHNCQNGGIQVKTSCTTNTFDVGNENFISIDKIGNELLINNPNKLEISKIECFSIDGKKVSDYLSKGQEIERIKINDSLPQGIYLICVFIGGEVLTEKFIISK